MTFHPISTLDVCLAALLMIVNGALSVGLRLGLERSLAIAAIRMLVQLSLLGLILRVIFSLYDPVLTTAVGTAMLGFAAFEVVQRQDRLLAGWWTEIIAAVTLLGVGWLGTLFTVLALIGPEPWHTPRVLLPILGMIAGSVLSGAAMALNTLVDSATRDRAEIETRLALGASRREAFASPLQRAARAAMLPIISQMSVAGLVTFPGLMTGQIIAGIDPTEAAKYQIMMMFVLAGTTGLGVAIALAGAIWRLTDSRDRLRADRLSPARGDA